MASPVLANQTQNISETLDSNGRTVRRSARLNQEPKRVQFVEPTVESTNEKVEEFNPLKFLKHQLYRVCQQMRSKAKGSKGRKIGILIERVQTTVFYHFEKGLPNNRLVRAVNDGNGRKTREAIENIFNQLD